MSLETELREISGHLTSNRANERKKAAESLKKFLDTGKAVPTLLSQNTKKKSGYSWNHVFEDIHAYVIKETEKFETSKTFQTSTAPLCTNLLHLCVSGANNGHAYMKCEKLTDACLHVLVDSRLSNAIGDAYLSLLYKHILQNENYLIFISPTTWESLLDVCVSACFSKTSILDTVIKLKLLWLVIKNATNYCQFVIPLRDSLPKIKEYILKQTNDQMIQKIEIITLILESLYAECRLTLCEFMEGVLPSIFQFYNQNLDMKTKDKDKNFNLHKYGCLQKLLQHIHESSLFKLLEMSIMLHHPQGRTKRTSGSLAHDWNVWNKHLNSILEIVCSEIAFKQKQLDHSMKQCQHLSYVAAAIMYQVFTSSEDVDVNEYSSSSKKQRISSNNSKSFKDLIHELEGHSIPWIGIIQSYVKNFGLHISTEEYILLITALERIIISNIKIDWQDCEDLSIMAVNTLLTRQDVGTQDLSKDSLISFWNCCVRNSGTTNPIHITLHTIMLAMINQYIINYQIVEPLFVLYLEDRIPVNNHSLSTLICILYKFYSKCCSHEVKVKCLKWLFHGKVTDLDVLKVKELLLMLVTNSNVKIKTTENTTLPYHQDLYSTLFESIDKSLLFSEFECRQNMPHKTKDKVHNKAEIDSTVMNEIHHSLEQILTQYTSNSGINHTKKLEYARILHVIIHYLDVLLTYTNTSTEEAQSVTLFGRLTEALQQMYGNLTDTLKSSTPLRHKLNLLKCVQSVLHHNYNSVLNAKIRSSIDKDCFQCINRILNTDTSDDDEAMYEEDDTEISERSLKYNCILLLAEYCRKREFYTQELLSCILESDLYDFKFQTDVDCAFRCIELLNENDVEQPPLVLTFNLMLDMCKNLFRYPRSSKRLLQLLLQMLDRIWTTTNEDTKKNLVIMIKSYLQRSSNRYYPPHTVVLVYECVAKMISLTQNQNFEYEDSFKEVLFGNVKDSVHNIRIYSCYLLKILGASFTESDFQCYMEILTEIFITNISQTNRTVLADETANRTSTLLHGFYGLTQAKQCLLHDVIMKMAQLQVEKNLDKHIVKKVLILLLKEITGNTPEAYLCSNIVNILYYWFLKNKRIDEFPIFLFGYDNFEVFLVRHMKWIVAADILWYKKGELQKSDCLKTVAEKANRSQENIVEMCFSNILTLCLPYIVTEKYKISMDIINTNISGHDANRLLQVTRFLLKEEKWTNLFVENLGELVLIAANNLCDYKDAREKYGLSIPRRSNTFTYSKDVFMAVLKYFGHLNYMKHSDACTDARMLANRKPAFEVMDSNIIHFLCNEQALAILHILFKLCGKVSKESVFEFRILFMNSYLNFIDTLPLGCTSDAILYNFACVSILHAIRDSNKKEELNIFGNGLQKVLTKIVAHDIHVLQKSVVSKAVSILTIKKEEGFKDECEKLLTYLTTDVKKHFRDGDDVVDFISAISEGNIQDHINLNLDSFKEKLQTYAVGLCHPSIETLLNLQTFLKNNGHFVNALCEELDPKGFSEYCETSIIHRVIFALSNIIKYSSDDKIKIEACNCLAEIGTYDIKTLVTVSPANTKIIVKTIPKQYFANIALKSCSNILFNESPSTSNKVVEAISHILKFADGRKALDSDEIDKNMLKCLSQSDCTTGTKFPVDSSKLQLYSQIDYWVPRDESHSQWITRITAALLDSLVSPNNYINSLRQVCLTKPVVCSELLPALIGVIVHNSSETGVLIGRQLNHLFEHIWNKTINNNNKENILDYDQKKIIQYLLDVVNFVRVQAHHYERRRVSPSESYNYLKLDYDKVSWAACVGDQHLDAIYYGELWAAAKNDCVPPANPEATSTLNGGQKLQEIFRKCFASIGESDAVEGCGTAHLRDAAEQRRACLARARPADALLLLDVQLAQRGQSPLAADLALGVVAALHHAGMHYLALQYITSHPDDDRMNDIKFDCLSYLGDWSNFVDTRELSEKLQEKTCQPSSLLKAYRYACLKDCLNIKLTKDFAIRLNEPLNGAKLAAAKLCQGLNMENCQSVYQVVENLHLFRDIEQYHAVRNGIVNVADLIRNWKVSKLPKFKEFKHIESLITQRSVILNHAVQSYDTFKADIVALQLQYAELGLSNERTQIAQRVLALVKDIDTTGRVQFVESQISWAKGYKDIALFLLHDVVSNPSASAKLSAESFRQYGLWMAECKRENTREIINKYLEKSLEFATIGNDMRTKTKVSYDIAKFADEEYKQVATYMKSQIFENKVKCMKSIKDTAATLRCTQLLTGDEKKAWATNNAFGEIEEAEIVNTIAERQSFLILAMRYYLLSLTQCDDYNLSIFRVVSLWLENPTLDLEDKEEGRLVDLINSIPSWKFLNVLPQLAPRLSNDDTPFAVHLKEIIMRCASEHPHHTLPMLFSLKNSDADPCSPAPPTRSSRGARGAGGAGGAGGAKGDGSPELSGEARVRVAAAQLAALPARCIALEPVLAQMERLCEAMIKFAYLVPNKRELTQAVPRTEPLSTLKHLDAIPVPTETVPVRKDGNYTDIISLIQFEKYYEMVGGINCPKKISCYCSDGKKRILLVKGQDDMRQDAMMQQVFNIVNDLLEKNPVTNQNKLYIRTYKVVPMSRQSGVLQWCEGTTPLGVYLAEAHSRLRPKDMSHSAARMKLVECHENKRSNEKKLQVFLDILKHLKPIFHFFFTEHYLDPVTWYERRLAYTRSVAASSMVGYIMGLGDRHVKNILIDKCTAEVVHIDFGIAFDQGTTLRTPETVPFRLTQDMIAGFGCNGVEGVFRKCCEKTLQLLRDNQETLLTILEVLLCDPLHSWAISDKKLRENSVQCAEEAPVGALAERALLAVRHKLAGGAGGVSAQGHAARLLADAADPAHLCRLFPGWQPYF